MFEQDYIVRMIKEMVRAILKLVFQIDSKAPTEELLKNEEEREKLQKLLDMVDAGQINEAENQIYDLAVGGERAEIMTALLFYSYLNDKSDSFLEEHDFCRKEIRDGVKRMANALGVSGIAELFTEEF